MATFRSQAVHPLVTLPGRGEPEIPRLRDLLAQAPAAIGYLNGPDLRWEYVNDLCVRTAGQMHAKDLLGLP